MRPRKNSSPSPSNANLVPSLRSPGKTQPTEQLTELGREQTNPAPVGWMSKQKAAAIGHLTKLTHRGRIPAQVEVATDKDAESAERSSQILGAVQTSIDDQKDDKHVNSTVTDHPGQSHEPIIPSTLTERMQEMLSSIPSIASSIGSGSSQSPPPVPQTEADDIPSPVRDRHFLAFLTLPKLENGPFEQSWRSFWSALGRLRLPYSKTTNTPEPSQDDVLDCIDDNNSVMMYGPLEPDDTSEVEIACSEIVSINGDGDEIRTPQPQFTPLPSESVDEALVGRGPRSPPPHFVSLPLESIDQMLMGGGREASSARWKEGESENISGATFPSTADLAVDQPSAKEYRVWLPSPTKISVQTMWWGFRIYLPPPVLDVLNNKQLEAAKRAAIITTALQWLMDHLPISLLPPQMHPGVAILRRLVPYVGYMGGFIAWSWSAIRSFDKGYGVVLTATWLLPFALIPGTWEADQAPNLSTDSQSSRSVFS